MKTYLHTAYLLFSLLIMDRAFADTRHSTGSGNWNTAATWNASGSPVCGDSIVIQAGHTISVTTQQNYGSCAAPMRVIIYGTLMFYNGAKLSLPCGSYVMVYPGGVVDHDEGLAISNIINICDNVEWNSNSTLYGPACLPETHPVCSQVLPIELIRFTAEACEAGRICLSWQTISETLNDHFEIEHSKNGEVFSHVGSVLSGAPNGNSLQPVYYNYVHENPAVGIDYYRLKQVDRNAAFSYSKIISASADPGDGLKFLVFPSYTSGEFTAQVTGLRDSGKLITLMRDASGNLVYKALSFYEDASAQITLRPGKKLAAGVYFCSFIVNEQEHVVKIFAGND